MTTTTVDLDELQPIDRAEAVALGRVEYRRLVAALEALTDADWERPTDCTGWTVRDLAGHLAGSMQTVSSFLGVAREQLAVMRRSKRTGEAPVDAMTAIQVERTAHMSPDELVRTMASLVDPAADGRGRVPKAVARAIRFKVEMLAIAETWELDYLLGPILTRDTWLHRTADLARAVGAVPVLDADHDGRIVADVAREWVSRHRRPVELRLTGPAGGAYVARGDTATSGGADVDTIEIDAVEFCRVMSGRAEPTHPLLATQVPF